MGWLIDPAAESVLIYSPPCQVAVLDQATEPLTVPAFAGELALTVGELFAWLFE